MNKNGMKMEYCTICGCTVYEDEWKDQNGHCDKCFIAHQVIMDSCEIDRERIAKLENAMRDFIDEWALVPDKDGIVVADDAVKHFKELLGV